MSIIYTSAADVGLEITARLQQIGIANGYATDIGARVYRGRIAIDDDLVPCASVIEGNDEVQTGPSQRFASAHLRQQYALIGYAPCDPDNPNDAAHQIIRDLQRAMFGTDGKPDVTWGGKVRAIRYRGRNIGPRADGKAIVMALIEIEVEFVHTLA